MKKRIVRIAIYIAAIFISVSLLIGEFSFFSKAFDIRFDEQARIHLDTVAGQLSTSFAKAHILTDSITSHLTSQLLSKPEISKMMTEIVGSYPINGLFFTIDSPARQVYSLLYSAKTGFIDIPPGNENYKEYTRQTLVKGCSWWTFPMMDELMGERIVGCCVPFRAKSGESGVVMVIYNTTHLYDRLQNMGLNRFGLPYMMDSLTYFVAHPVDEIRSLAELADNYHDSVLKTLVNDLRIGNLTQKNYTHDNTVTGKKCSEILAPIAGMGWIVGLSVYDGHSLESASYRQAMKRSGIRIIIYLVITLILLLIVINEQFFRCRKPQLYYSSLPFVSLCVITAVIAIYDSFPVNGYLSDQQEYDKDVFEQTHLDASQRKLLDEKGIKEKWDPRRIVDSRSLATFINGYGRQAQELYGEPTRLIPTGIHIQAIEFDNSCEIRVSGILWQKFLNEESAGSAYHTHEYPKKGILFPGARISSYELADSIDIFLDGHSGILCRWNFDIDIPQKLSNKLFPFGTNELSLPLWSADLDDNTLIVPDLEAYKQTFPDICPGLASNLSISGWNIVDSYYSYSIESYLTNFGNTYMRGVNRFPELIFNVSVSRKFLDSLVCKIIPLSVVLVLLFTILFVRNDSDGFNNIIGCSGLFFVLILDHINLRESVTSGGIMYLEFCYFFTYLLLLLITVTSFRVDSGSSSEKFLKITNTILMRYFWTIILGLMAITTIVRFY